MATATAVKERPIKFTRSMVRAVLDERKWQTRRLMSPQPPEWVTSFGYTAFTPAGHISGRGDYGNAGPSEKFFRLPYGVPGDLLRISEDVTVHLVFDGDKDKFSVLYHADNSYLHRYGTPALLEKIAAYKRNRMRAVHLPAAYARLARYSIISTRAERVQDITDEDAYAEGIVSNGRERERFGLPEWGHEEWQDTPRAAFLHLFYGNNKRAERTENPWVWVISFTPVTRNQKQE